MREGGDRVRKERGREMGDTGDYHTELHVAQVELSYAYSMLKRKPETVVQSKK